MIETNIPEYMSMEQHIEEKILKPIGREIYDFSKMSYKTIAPIFKIPTTIRKFTNNQISKIKNTGNLLGAGSGAIGGGFYDIYAIFNMMDYLGGKNKIPDFILSDETLFYTFIATNIASGIYEWGRLSKSKLEHQILFNSKKEK